MRLSFKVFSLGVCSVVLSGCTILGRQVSTPQPTPQVIENTMPANFEEMETEGEKMMMKAYTLDDIAQHKTKDNCWMSIEGKVYDVTPMTSSDGHPGGAVILQGCGTDATKLFNNRPGNKGPHPESVEAGLENFFIGDLEQ